MESIKQNIDKKVKNKKEFNLIFPLLVSLIIGGCTSTEGFRRSKNEIFNGEALINSEGGKLAEFSKIKKSNLIIIIKLDFFDYL